MILAVATGCHRTTTEVQTSGVDHVETEERAPLAGPPEIHVRLAYADATNVDVLVTSIRTCPVVETHTRERTLVTSTKVGATPIVFAAIIGGLGLLSLAGSSRSSDASPALLSLGTSGFILGMSALGTGTEKKPLGPQVDEVALPPKLCDPRPVGAARVTFRSTTESFEATTDGRGHALLPIPTPGVPVQIFVNDQAVQHIEAPH
jgi:hypothetical protein